MHKIGNVLSSSSAAVAVITVALLPWMLGGVVPVARAVLLIGAVAAGLVSLCSHLLLQRRPNAIPLVAVPLTALTLLGIWQLRPAPDQLQFIVHGVTDRSEVVASTATSPASLSPPDTRSGVATLLAATILVFVCFDQIRSLRRITFACLLLVLNGVSIMAVGLSHLLTNTVFSWNEVWSLGGTRGSFATFANPNNAAGWLCLCFAIAMGWLSFQMKSASTNAAFQGKTAQTPLLRMCSEQICQFVADLDVGRILPCLAVALLATGVAATRSRGGILALAISIAVTLVIKFSVRRLPAALLILTVCAGSVHGLLWWLDLDQTVITEMDTLRDLDAAAGARPRHWMDSMRAVMDFPVTGMGLGSYRFATLPYQSEFARHWYRNADNQYVEILVEGGLFGLMLFVSIGLCGLVTGIRALKESRPSNSLSSEVVTNRRRRLSAALGMTVLLATLSQAISACFDFGVGMPAAIAMFTVLVATAAGVLSEDVRATSVRETGAVRSSSTVVLTIQICVLCAAAAQIPDLIAAAEIDSRVVAGHRLLTPPMTPNKLDRLKAEQSLLEARLSKRPDDPEGLRMLSRLALVDFRWQIMLADSGESIKAQDDLDAAFQKFTIYALAAVARQDHPETAHIRSQIAPMLDTSGMPEILENLQHRFPLMPRIALARAQISVLLDDDAMYARQAYMAMFVEPANAEMLFQLGSLALRCGQPEFAQRLWQRSSQLSVDYLTGIFLNARGHWNQNEALQLFSPRDYTRCVQAAQKSQDLTLTTKLYERAEQFWDEQQSRRTDTVDLLRAVHLNAIGRTDDAISWLRECVLLPGERLAHRRYLAQLLEDTGLYMDAMQEWHAIRTLASGDAQADAAIERLRTLD